MRQRFSRLLSFVLAVAVVMTMVTVPAGAAEVASGTCGADGDGSNLTWSLDDSGTLTISGTGDMKDAPFGERGPWYSYASSITSVNIGTGVTSIGDSAFEGCNKLTNVTIPNGVTRIGKYAFESCSGLTDVIIPDSVNTIDLAAFGICRSLTSVTIPNSVTAISSYLFQGCSNLTSVTIPNGVTRIGSYAFEQCSNLTSVTIPDSVTFIDHGAFRECSKLIQINISENNANYCIKNDALCNKDGTFFHTYPAGLNGNGGNYEIPTSITRIGSEAFGGCCNLVSVTMPNSVTSIDSSTFYHCENLASVTISSNITEISRSMFMSCRALTSVTIPDGVTYINDSAFYSCQSLTNITIPSSVTGIGSEAFYNCQNLTLSFENNAPRLSSFNDTFESSKNITVRYSYGNTSWDDTIKNQMNTHNNCTFRAYGQTEFTVSPRALDYNTTDAVITVTSSNIPFDEAQADLVTVDSTDTTDLTVTNAEVVDGALKLTVHSDGGAQTGTFSVNIPAAALVADPSDANNETIGESVVTLAVPNPGEVIPQLTPSPASVPNGSTAPAITITSSVPFSTGFNITDPYYCTADFGDTELTINSFHQDGTNEITVFFQSAGGDGAQAGNIQLTFLPAAFAPDLGYLVQRDVVYTVSVPLAEYTVSFDGNGGTGDMPSLTVKEDAAFRLPACQFTAPSGQFFAGWCANSDPTILAAGSASTLTGDIRLTAQWKALPNVTAGTPVYQDDGSVEVVITTDTPVDPGSVGTTIPLPGGGTATITDVSPDGTEITVDITDVAPGDEIDLPLPGSIFTPDGGITYPDVSVPTITVPLNDRDGDGYDDLTGDCLHALYPSLYAARSYCTVANCEHPADCACGGPAPRYNGPVDEDGDGYDDITGECLHTRGEDGYCTETDCPHPADCTCGGHAETAPSRKPKTDKEPKADEPTDVIEVDDTVETHDPEEIVISGTGESPLGDITKPEEYADWIDRVKLPDYALTLYRALEIGGDNDQLYDLLIKDEYMTLSGGGAGETESGATVESVVTLVSEMDRPLANGSGIFQSDNFRGSFDVIDTTAGDRAINYPALKEGAVVRTATFNGIYVTKVRKDGNANYDSDIKEACAYASTSFQAFDRDHPEVFWLSGKTKLRMVTAKAGDKRESYIFFVLVDHEGFTMRDSRYPNQLAIETEIARMETAVQTILQTVTSATVNEQVRQLNRWLTEHNEYNTSADLQHLPNWPHECMSALVGSIGTDGPVCDGYARAFKVLCDRLEIPCVLVDGYAKTSAQAQGQFHMWNSVQLPDGEWYGVDVTWNDPVVKGVSGAKSGHENENFLLTGGDTVALGMKFSESHPPVNRAANGGVSFINGPTLSAAAYDPHSPVAGLPFTDVQSGDWFAGEVKTVYEKGIMTGVTADRFAPDTEVSRAMVLSVLYRIAGEPSAEPAAFDDVEAGEWYAAPISWATGVGIAEAAEGSRFAPNAILEREGLALWLWRAAGSPAPEGALDGFTDRASVSADAGQALRWAVGEGIIVGSNGQLDPKGSVTRAQAAAMLVRYLESTGDNAA